MATIGVVIAGVVVVAVALRGSGPSTPDQSTPTLAQISTSVNSQTVDGMPCTTNEQLIFHTHAHLAVYANGAPRTIPEGVGIMPPRTEISTLQGQYVTAGVCFYPLHTHTADGIVHIESPVQRTYTLGNFFDVWGIALDGQDVGPVKGTVIAYVNGQRYASDLRSIPLNRHDLIQLDVNGDVAPQPFTFPANT